MEKHACRTQPLLCQIMMRRTLLLDLTGQEAAPPVATEEEGPGEPAVTATEEEGPGEPAATAGEELVEEGGAAPEVVAGGQQEEEEAAIPAEGHEEGAAPADLAEPQEVVNPLDEAPRHDEELDQGEEPHQQQHEVEEDQEAMAAADFGALAPVRAASPMQAAIPSQSFAAAPIPGVQYLILDGIRNATLSMERSIRCTAATWQHFDICFCVGLSIRQYLDTTVVPVLRLGLRELVKARWGATRELPPCLVLHPQTLTLFTTCLRPEDPFDFLADYIRANKPK